ncbi:MAG TPA: hypothetical protein VJ746_05040 [Nitrospira sp.]|nr:hypothetical protein [Nitrospira sp.]
MVHDEVTLCADKTVCLRAVWKASKKIDGFAERGDVKLKKRINRFAFVVILSVMSGQGCTAVLTSDQSEMQLSSSENQSRIFLDSITIQVVPQNGRAYGVVGPLIPVIPFWYSQAKDRFWLLISLRPETSEISFDPSHVALETEQGDTRLPIGFSGPFSVQDFTQNSYLNETILDEKTLNFSFSVISISAEVLVGLMFDKKTPNPNHQFTVFLKGIKKQGQTVLVPPLKFKNVKKRHFDFLLFSPLNIHKEWIVESKL